MRKWHGVARALAMIAILPVLAPSSLPASAEDAKAPIALTPAPVPPAPASLAPAPASLAPAPASLAPAPESIEGRLSALLNEPAAKPSDRKAKAALTKGDSDDLAAAKSFYEARNFAPLWVTVAGLNARAKQVSAEIARAGDWGLTASDFVLPVLSEGTSPQADLASAELTLTRAALKYARFARGGRIPDPSGDLSSYLDRKPQLMPPQGVLADLTVAASPAGYLSGLNPRQPQFENLRQAYLKARGEQDRLAGARIDGGPMLKPGTNDPRVKALRTRLGVIAPPRQLAAVGGPNSALQGEGTDTYDQALVDAVRAFQVANGLRGDGMIGEKTRQALNGPGNSIIPRLLAIMEEWRWMPADLGATHVEINIPQYQMQLIKGGTVVHTERVVTGKPDSSTPVFSENMQTVVFQPKWGVPDSIKIGEMLPRLQRGDGLRSGLKMTLNGRDIDPWSVDWSRADITHYQIYQPSGEDNALGVVKFLFPNKHAVYLHDTPSKSLFNASTRAYSHGCIRVRNPVRLAELVLNADKGWDAAKVRSLVEDGPEDNRVMLDAKIPVHVMYFTVTADANGKVDTYPDVYGHEKRITQALNGRYDQIAKLEPPKLDPRGNPQAVAAAEGYGVIPANRRRGADPAFAPPAALGYSPPPQPAFFQLFSGKSSGSSSSASHGRNYQGNSSNDMIMRQLGGF